MFHSPGRFTSLTVVVLFALLVLGQAVFGFQPVSQDRQYELRLPEFLPIQQVDKAPEAREVVLTEALGSLYGGRWTVFSRNLQTRSPHMVYGKSLPLGGPLRTPSQVENLARQVMRDNPGVFSGKGADLKFVKAPHAAGKWAAHFQQTYKGIDVWQGKALVVFSEEGRLILLGSDIYPDIDLDVQPRLDQAMVELVARESVPFQPDVDFVKGRTDLLILPVPVSPDKVEYHLVYRVRVRTSEPLGEWVTHVDAHDGTVLWRFNDIHFDHEGGTRSLVQDDTYCNEAAAEAMPHLRLDLNGGTLVTTDADGNWTSTGTSGELAITADLYGPFCDVNNTAGDDAAFSGTAPEGDPFTVLFDDSNSQQDERDAFDAVNDIHDFFETFAPGFSQTQERMQTFVSRTGGWCPGNAWWDGTINFCAAGGDFGNTGEIQGVIFHEYGHGVQNAILGWQGDQGLGEGNADILALLMTNNPALGLGYYLDNCEDGLRDANNTLVYPDDVVGQEVHAAGMVLMGFHWKAQEDLVTRFGVEEGIHIAATNWHNGRVLLQPTNQPDQVLAMFVADDDDDDLGNGTPHYDSYCLAAGIHGFDCPEITTGVRLAHTPLADTLDGSQPFEILATVYSTEGDILEESVELHWRARGGAWNTAAMTATGNENEYRGWIPSLSAGGIDYYISATDVQNNQAVLPQNAPAIPFSFVVATSIDPVEVVGSWVAGAGDDDATSGTWELVDPVATLAQPEDDHSVEGVTCWITGQQVVGQGDGYSDVDGGKTTLFSPVYDLAAYDQASIRYWKWYSNNKGYNPNQDYWDVSVSNDGGASWTAVEHTTESTNAWVGVTVNIRDYFESVGQVQLMFVASDEGDGSLVEAGIDDVMIVAYDEVTPVDGEMLVIQPSRLYQNRPNPFNPVTEISFSLARSGPVKLGIYDVTGRLVKTLLREEMEAGRQSVQWNGTGTDGRTVASGVYFYRLEAGGRVLSKRMLLLK